MEISRIVCINHPLAALRLEAMNERFRQQKMKVELSPGVIPGPGEESWLGCLRAHKKAIAQAKNDKLKNILIFEDDVFFLKPWSWIQEQLKDLPEDFDLLRLGLTTDGVYIRKHIKNHIFKCQRAFGTQCYLVNSSCFEAILNLPESDPYDCQLAAANLKEYAIHPLPIYHELGSSYLGNLSMQLRDEPDLKLLTREQALDKIDSVLNTQLYPMNTQLRIAQALGRLKVKAKTQELRFLRSIIEKTVVSRADAIDLCRSLFILAIEEQSEEQN